MYFTSMKNRIGTHSVWGIHMSHKVFIGYVVTLQGLKMTFITRCQSINIRQSKEDSSLLGCDPAWLVKWFPTFRKKMLLSLSKVRSPWALIFWRFTLCPSGKSYMQNGKKYGELVEWYWQGKTVLLGGNHFPVTLRTSQISHGSSPGLRSTPM